MSRALPEIIHFGSYDASSVHKNRTVTPNRRVSLYEIEYITYDGGISYINENSYEITKNSVIVAKPGQIRHTKLPFKPMYIHLIADDSETAALLNRTPDFFVPENPEEYKTLIQDIITASTQTGTDSSFTVYEKLFALFSLLSRSTTLYETKGNATKSNIETIKKAIKYINENFRENITLGDIASHANFSRIYFRNMFISATGISPNKYLQNIRVSKARELLLTTDKSLLQIAAESGFSSQSYMNYVFKMSEGCSPREYKKKNAYF